MDGFPVFGSDARVVFNYKGELQKVSFNWRQIDPKPIETKTVIDETILLEQGLSEIYYDYSPAATNNDLYRATYAYEDIGHREEQTTFELRYVFDYVYDHESFVMHHSLVATE